MASTCLTAVAAPQFPMSLGVTAYPAPHGANAIQLNEHVPTILTAKDLLRTSCYKEFKKMRNDHLIQNSFEDAKVFDDVNKDGPQFLSASNGFVDSAVKAYSHHHHLIIRPEDVWFSVLVQLNIYINEHAEELRSMFVSHKGQKKLVLDASSKEIRGKAGTTTWLGVDFAKFAYQIGKEIEKNIIDPSLREWFMPAFTTTTKSDQATASIIMMSTMQKYFSYECSIDCGLPSVTLLGRKDDWEKMLQRLERLKTFGDEPTMWYGLLKPVFTKFVETFDDPNSKEVKDFWQKIAHYSGGGSGPTYLSGWITAFCFWDGKAKVFHKPGHNPPPTDTMDTMEDPTPVLTLDGARYHRIEMDDIPPGWVTVPVVLDDDGDITNAAMVAGSVGMYISTRGFDLHAGNDEKRRLDTIQPSSGWWMYETMSEEETMEKRRQEYEEMRARFSWYPEWKGKESLAWLEE